MVSAPPRPQPPIVIEGPTKEREAVKIWRTATEPRIIDTFHTRDGYCAVGLLLHRIDVDSLGSVSAMFVALRDYFKIIEVYDRAERCPVCHKGDYSGAASMLYHWNDEHAQSFSDVADLAEQYPELIFDD